MRITVYGIGGRGDVQPLVALAAGLQTAGYQVRFASHREFEPLARQNGLAYTALSGQPAAFFGGAAGTALRDRLRSDPAAYRRFFESYLAPFMEQMLSECLEAGEQADCVVSWPWMRVVPTIAERLGVSAIIASPVPTLYLPTSEFANPFCGDFAQAEGEANRRSWHKAKDAFGAGQEVLARFRSRMGLPPRTVNDEYDRFQHLPHILGFSGHILPKPADWPASVTLTGAWRLDSTHAYEPPAHLTTFLDDGPPPVLIGFSSSVGTNPKAMTPVIVDAVRRSGKRAIFVAGFGGLQSDELPRNILAVETVPYSWILPRTAAIIHHGGAGSTWDGLRAGCPSLAIPFGWDQPLWAWRIHDVGAGCPPIPAAELSVDRLAASIVELVEKHAFRERAREISALLQAEDGVARAVETVSAVLGEGRRRGVSHDSRHRLAR